MFVFQLSEKLKFKFENTITDVCTSAMNGYKADIKFFERLFFASAINKGTHKYMRICTVGQKRKKKTDHPY